MDFSCSIHSVCFYISVCSYTYRSSSSKQVVYVQKKRNVILVIKNCKKKCEVFEDDQVHSTHYDLLYSFTSTQHLLRFALQVHSTYYDLLYRYTAPTTICFTGTQHQLRSTLQVHSTYYDLLYKYTAPKTSIPRCEKR